MKRLSTCYVTGMARTGQRTGAGFMRWESAIIRPRRSPWQNGHVERLIGSIRRECLDHLVVFGETHLRRVFETYASYYNELGTHLSCNKDAPRSRSAQPVGPIAALPVLGGLHHPYVRV